MTVGIEYHYEGLFLPVCTCVCVLYVLFANSHVVRTSFLLLLGGELLAERCRTNDLMPSIPISCLPPCCMDPEVQGLYILIYCSQPGGSWATNGSPSVCWWS